MVRPSIHPINPRSIFNNIINNSISFIKTLPSHIEVNTTSIYENYGSDIEDFFSIYEVTYSDIENFTSISEDLKPQYVSLKVILGTDQRCGTHGLWPMRYTHGS